MLPCDVSVGVVYSWLHSRLVSELRLPARPAGLRLLARPAGLRLPAKPAGLYFNVVSDLKTEYFMSPLLVTGKPNVEFFHVMPR